MLICTPTQQGATGTRLVHRRSTVQAQCFKCLTSSGKSHLSMRAISPPRQAVPSNAPLPLSHLQRTLLNHSQIRNRRTARMCADANGSGDVTADREGGIDSTGPEADHDASVSPGEDLKKRKTAEGKGIEDRSEDQGLGVTVALAVLRFYKREISPILPPSCRFLPTCSEYAMESYQTFGVGKGTVLTAWRLMRCNPFGPSGYDPVRWPPPGLEWMIRS